MKKKHTIKTTYTSHSTQINMLTDIISVSSWQANKITAYLVRIDGIEYIKVIWKNPWVATIEVTDYEWTKANFDVHVGGSGSSASSSSSDDEWQEEGEFQEIHYEEKSSNEWLDTIGFQLDWDYEEVGIFYLENNEIYKQELHKQSSGLYILSCDISCPDRSVPYILSEGIYKKANPEYISFWEESYTVANVEESWIEINSIIKKWDKFYQYWSPDFWTKNSIDYHYLNGMEIAIIDFFNEDTDNYSWNPNTATKIVKLASWERSLQSSINSIPDIKVLWDNINSDIVDGTHSYSDETRRYIKWYLWISAVIEEDNWQIFDQVRVKKYIEEFHLERQLISRIFWDALHGDAQYTQKHVNFNLEVEKISNRVNNRLKKSPRLFSFLPWVTKISYSKKNVEILKSINVITDDEYSVLIKVEDEYKKLYKEWLEQLVFKEKQQGSVDWADEALKDYIVESLLIFNPAEFAQIISGLTKLDLETITEGFEELIDIYNNREEIFAWLSDYDKAYYTAYIETTLAMVIVPIKLNKVNKLKGKDTETVQKLKTLKVENKLLKTWLVLSPEWLQHIKDRHLLWWSLYNPSTSSYFYSESSITTLIKTIDFNWVQPAKNGKYSITKIHKDNIWYDRDSWDTKLLTVIFDDSWNVITAHPGLPTN